jgi:HK97 family phage prohead protease
MKNKKLDFKFRVKAEESAPKELFIEGFANRAMMNNEKIIDRGKEHIPAGEWKIDEWKKNPIIFFNHDRNMPIGKGVGAKVTEDGLWIKAQISQSEAPEIKKVRDLINEGILRTFSVGIDVEDEEVDSKDQSITLKGVNLLETSVVSIPMNQESFFSITQKSLAETPLDMLEAEILEAEGKEFAAGLHKAMYVKSLSEGGFDREALLEVEGVKEVLAGDELPGEELAKLFEDELGFKSEELALEEDEKEEKADPEEEVPAEEGEVEGSEGVGKEDGPTVELGTEDQLTQDLGQPALQALQQLTVLMGQLIAETQKTQKLLEGLGNMPDQEELAEDPEEEMPEEAPAEDEEELTDEEMGGDTGEMLPDEDEEDQGSEESKSLDMIAGYKEKLERTLSRFAL